MNIGCATFDGGSLEPAELVRSFSMTIKAKYKDASKDESPIERALIEDFEMKEKRRRARIQEIEKYLETTKYDTTRRAYHELIRAAKQATRALGVGPKTAGAGARRERLLQLRSEQDVLRRCGAKV